LKHFTEREFLCNCGCGGGYEKMDTGFLDRLDRARNDAGIPFKLNSAFRCIIYNLSVGGKPNSAHRTGHAVDIAYDTSYQLFYIINSLIRNGFTRMGVASNFVHVDSDPDLPDDVIWTYYK